MQATLPASGHEALENGARLGYVARGFVYLAVLMDWATRRVLSWRLSITLDSTFCIAAVEEAIARFEAALTIATREKDPDRWAAAHNNLANAYGKRLRGDQADNREAAIAHLEAALSVFSRDTHREQCRRPVQPLAAN